MRGGTCLRHLRRRQRNPHVTRILVSGPMPRFQGTCPVRCRCRGPHSHATRLGDGDSRMAPSSSENLIPITKKYPRPQSRALPGAYSAQSPGGCVGLYRLFSRSGAIPRGICRAPDRGRVTRLFLSSLP